MTLYLKYRPKNLDELDETAVAETLKKILSQKNIPHAFLFAGPKGTGKTSAARILAKILNCEDIKDGKPCDKCGQCVSITNGNNLDVVEMDAASHRGIDDVRVLRDAVKLAPVSAKKKIYIIDEVHMLTTEASNALLKTLEEPPEHVVFVLATTNPEKLIETIRSRTTLIQFRKASVDEIVKSLKRVADGEKVKIDESGLHLIAQAGDGAFRDAIKIMEQLIAEEVKPTQENLSEFLFKNRSYDLDDFIKSLYEKNIGNLLKVIDGLTSNGVGVEVFTESLIKKLRLGLLSKVGVGDPSLDMFSKDELVNLVELFTKAHREIGESPIDELPVELAVMRWCGDSDGGGQDGTNKADRNSSVTDPKQNTVKFEPEDKTDSVIDNTLNQKQFSGAEDAAIDIKIEEGAWRDILSMIKPINASMEALLRAAKPVSYNGKVLTLAVYYKFHKERIEEAKHRKILEDVVAKVLQSPTKVNCTLVDPPPKKIIEEARVETVLTEGKDKDIVEIAEKIFSN